MRTIVKGKNIDITPALRNYATKKTSKLEKFFEDGPEVSCEVMMRVERELDIVEITLQVNGVLMRERNRRKICTHPSTEPLRRWKGRCASSRPNT